MKPSAAFCEKRGPRESSLRPATVDRDGALCKTLLRSYLAQWMVALRFDWPGLNMIRKSVP